MQPTPICGPHPSTNTGPKRGAKPAESWASQAGTDAEELVKKAALRLLERDARFRAGVDKGLEQADCGEFVSEEEMDSRIERMIQA
jgi:predicted transcriptional regulator